MATTSDVLIAQIDMVKLIAQIDIGLITYIIFLLPRHEIPQFHLLFWFGNFVERHSFRRVLGNLLKTLRKLCISTKFSLKKLF